MFIGIDLGGTNVKGIVVDHEGRVLRQKQTPTKDTGDGSWRVNVLETLTALKLDLSAPIKAVGLSAPGLPDAANRCIAYLPNRLHGLENFDWSDYLGETTRVLNDAHAALIAEATFGAAKGLQNVVLLTLGTGVGGGILINGQLYQGLGQMAGHLGHVCVNSNDDVTSILGMPGSLEYAMGNYSIQQRSHGRYASTWDLVTAYRNGEHLGVYLWLDSVRTLALGISSFINALSPDAIVLSGGITLAEDALFGPLSAFLDVYEFRPGGKKTPILKAEFTDMAGAMGAAAFAMNEF